MTETESAEAPSDVQSDETNSSGCPKCGSSDIGWTATFVGGTEFSSGPAKASRCKDCGHTFDVDEPQTRSLPAEIKADESRYSAKSQERDQ